MSTSQQPSEYAELLGLPNPPVVWFRDYSSHPDGDIERYALCRALQTFVSSHVVPTWGTPCTITQTATPLAWQLTVWDSYDQQSTLGSHTSSLGLPMGNVYRDNISTTGQTLSQVLSHELVEMLVDPAVNLCAFNAKGEIFAYEAADPVEDQTFLVGAYKMSNFVYPLWFESWPLYSQQGQYDHLKNLSAPFTLSKGGYIPVFSNGHWTSIFGSVDKLRSYSTEDRRGHRTEFRKHALCSTSASA